MNVDTLPGRWDKVTNFAAAFQNCYLATGSPFCPPNVTNFRFSFYECNNITGAPVCGDKVSNMAGTYYNCRKLTGSPVVGPNVTDMTAAYKNCTNLTGSPVCSPNVVNITNAYAYCTNLSGAPSNCEAVRILYRTFQGMPNLYGDFYLNYNGTSAVNGLEAFQGRDNNRILSIYVKPNSKWNTWFHNTAKLYNNSAPLTWVNYTNRYANAATNTIIYYGARTKNLYLNQLNMEAIFGYQVFDNHPRNYSANYIPASQINYFSFYSNETDFNSTIDYWNKFLNTSNSTEFIKVDNTANIFFSTNFLNTNVYFNENMSDSFANMACLTSLPIGSVNQLRFDYVINLVKTFNGCYRLNFNLRNCNFSNVTNMFYTFYDCRNLKGDPKVGPKVTNMTGTYYNCQNLIGAPVCGPNVTDMRSAYYNCVNLTGSGACGDNVTVMNYTYGNCFNLTEAYFGPNVNNVTGAYSNCNNIKTININCKKQISIYDAFDTTMFHNINIIFGPSCTNISNMFNYQGGGGVLYNNTNIIVGNNVNNMTSTFYWQRFMITSPVSGNNVIDMTGTYRNCYNLIGSPVCGPNVINMVSTYSNCYNLTGSPVCGPKVIDMRSAYYNCVNLTGNIIISSTVTNLFFAFYNCSKISTIVIPHSTALAMAALNNLCYRYVFTTRLNVIIANKTTYESLRANQYWVNASFTTAASYSGSVTVNGTTYTLKNYAYNTARNVYLYCTNA